MSNMQGSEVLLMGSVLIGTVCARHAGVDSDTL